MDRVPGRPIRQTPRPRRRPCRRLPRPTHPAGPLRCGSRRRVQPLASTVVRQVVRPADRASLRGTARRGRRAVGHTRWPSRGRWESRLVVPGMSTVSRVSKMSSTIAPSSTVRGTVCFVGSNLVHWQDARGFDKQSRRTVQTSRQPGPVPWTCPLSTESRAVYTFGKERQDR